MQEDKDFYPPRFHVFLASSPKDPTLSDGSIRFKGADCGLRYDIYLDLPDQDTLPSDTPPRMSSSLKSDVNYVFFAGPTSLPLVSGLGIIHTSGTTSDKLSFPGVVLSGNVQRMFFHCIPISMY